MSTWSRASCGEERRRRSPFSRRQSWSGVRNRTSGCLSWRRHQRPNMNVTACLVCDESRATDLFGAQPITPLGTVTVLRPALPRTTLGATFPMFIRCGLPNPGSNVSSHSAIVGELASRGCQFQYNFQVFHLSRLWTTQSDLDGLSVHNHARFGKFKERPWASAPSHPQMLSARALPARVLRTTSTYDFVDVSTWPRVSREEHRTCGSSNANNTVRGGISYISLN